jgi:hypothetical protein
MDLGITYRNQPDNDGWISAEGLDGAGEFDTDSPVLTCQITGRASVAIYIQLAHELYHCFQYEVAGNSRAVLAMVKSSQWVIEGGASFEL